MNREVKHLYESVHRGGNGDNDIFYCTPDIPPPVSCMTHTIKKYLQFTETHLAAVLS